MAQKRAEREEAEGQLASLATTLKHTATQLRDTLRKDNMAVDKIAELVENNAQGTMTQRKKLEKTVPPWWKEMLNYLTLCVVAFVMFLIVKFIIGHTKKRSSLFEFAHQIHHNNFINNHNHNHNHNNEDDHVNIQM